MKLTTARSSPMLIASLVLNVFLVGAMAGGAYRWATNRPAPAVAARPQGLRAAAAELSDARKAQLRGALQQTRQANRPLIVGARAGRLDVLHALQAEPFDPAALDAALARTRTADVSLRARLEQTVAQFAADLTPDERIKLIDGMERGGMLRRIEPPRK